MNIKQCEALNLANEISQLNPTKIEFYKSRRKRKMNWTLHIQYSKIDAETGMILYTSGNRHLNIAFHNPAHAPTKGA